MDKSKFSERLKLLCYEKGVSNASLAQALKVPIIYVSDYKKGLKSPSSDILIQTAQYFNVSTDFLIGLDNTMELDVEDLNETQVKILSELVVRFKASNVSFPENKIKAQQAYVKDLKIGAHLKELRIKNNKSQTMLADLLGVHQTTYGSYETGRLQPPINALLLLANYYGVTLEYLLGF